MENTMTEEQLQAQCFKWFDNEFPAERKMLFAVPNGGERPLKYINGRYVNIEGNKLKATGVQPGVSDMILVTNVITFIEMKYGRGVLSEDQLEFARKVSERGHEYRAIYSFEEFKKFIIRKITDYERANKEI